MSLSLILLAIMSVAIAAWLARLNFGLERPLKVLVAAGVFGAFLTIFGLTFDPSNPNAEAHWSAIVGTLLSFACLIGILGITLIWAIRRWGIKHDDNPWRGP